MAAVVWTRYYRKCFSRYWSGPRDSFRLNDILHIRTSNASTTEAFPANMKLPGQSRYSRSCQSLSKPRNVSKVALAIHLQ
jgi:hypothetical protein